MQTKTTDNKGRITLGERFANRTVIVEEVDETEVRVTLARIIPEREAWLYQNQAAREAVQRGIDQAKERRFAAPADAPDLAADAELADAIEDES